VKTSCPGWNAPWILLLALCFCLCGTSVAQNQYYVATTGSDSNDGSQARPWATINHANAALVVGPGGNVCGASNIGACVHVAPGTYTGAINTTKSGTVGARIRYLSDSKYGARLTAMWSSNGAYTDIVGFEMDGTGKPTLVNGMVAYTGDTLIQGNKVHDVASGCNSSQTAVLESAAAHTAGHGNTFDGNFLYHNNCGAGSWTDGIQPGSVNTGISLHSYDIAQNNIILDQDGWCLQVSHTATNAIVTNNIMANCDRAAMVVGFFSVSAGSITVTNNILINSGSMAQDGGLAIASDGCASSNIFRASGSNCVPPTDFVGAIRPLNSALDVGSYQFAATSATDLPSAPTGLTASVQ